MTWLKQNWVKSGIALGIIILGIAIGFYLLIFLPQKEHARVLEAKERECTRLGQERYERDRRESEGSHYVLLNPRYKYNEELDSCFYKYGSIGTISKYNTQMIIDLKTNKDMAGYSMNPASQVDEYTRDQMIEFNRVEHKIFGIE